MKQLPFFMVIISFALGNNIIYTQNSCKARLKQFFKNFCCCRCAQSCSHDHSIPSSQYKFQKGQLASTEWQPRPDSSGKN